MKSHFVSHFVSHGGLISGGRKTGSIGRGRIFLRKIVQFMAMSTKLTINC